MGEAEGAGSTGPMVAMILKGSWSKRRACFCSPLSQVNMLRYYTILQSQVLKANTFAELSFSKKSHINLWAT